MLRLLAQGHPTGKWHNHNSDHGPLAQEPATLQCLVPMCQTPRSALSTKDGGMDQKRQRPHSAPWSPDDDSGFQSLSPVSPEMVSFSGGLASSMGAG